VIANLRECRLVGVHRRHPSVSSPEWGAGAGGHPLWRFWQQQRRGFESLERNVRVLEYSSSRRSEIGEIPGGIHAATPEREGITPMAGRPNRPAIIVLLGLAVI